MILCAFLQASCLILSPQGARGVPAGRRRLGGGLPGRGRGGTPFGGGHRVAAGGRPRGSGGAPPEALQDRRCHAAARRGERRTLHLLSKLRASILRAQSDGRQGYEMQQVYCRAAQVASGWTS